MSTNAADTIKVLPNQSLIDVVIQACGTLEAGMQMMAANDRSISDFPAVGETLHTINQDADEKVDKTTLSYLAENGIVIGTLGTVPAVEFEVVLKPVLKAVPATATPPSVTGAYEFTLEAAAGFINTNHIPHTYYPMFPGPPINFVTQERYIAGIAPDTVLGLDGSGVGPPFMDDERIMYNERWVAGRGHMLGWSDMSPGMKTVTFIDEKGNPAYCAPLIVINNLTQDIQEYLIADLSVDLLVVDTNTATLRLKRSHPPVGISDFSHQVMNWLEDAAGGMPDPLDPLNPDVTILVLPRGTYTFGVSTLYIDGTIVYPASACTQVIEIR